MLYVPADGARGYPQGPCRLLRRHPARSAGVVAAYIRIVAARVFLSHAGEGTRTRTLAPLFLQALGPLRGDAGLVPLLSKVIPAFVG